MGERDGGRPLGVILTAGLGTRLRPLTPRIPKAMVPLLDRPLVDYALDAMGDLGVGGVVVVVGGDDEATARHARSRASAALPVSVAVQPRPRGPGDAVVSVGEALDGRSVVVLAVDTVLRGSARAALDEFLGCGAEAGLLLREVDEPQAFGVAVLEGGRVVDLEEKPSRPRSKLAVVGLWMLAPPAVERLRARPVINAKGESDLTATLAALVDEGSDVRGWVFGGQWLDGGSLEGLLHAQDVFLGDLAPTAVEAPGSDLSGPVAAREGARAVRCRLRGPLLLGPGARVDDCDLERVVIGAGARLRGVRLRDALVAPGATLEGGDYARVVVTAGGEVGGPGAPPRSA